MLLQSRLDHKTVLLIDTEAVGGVNKDEMEVHFHPDDALDHVVQIATGIARNLAVTAAGAESTVPKPMALDVDFGLKIDSNATVAVARTPESGQFRVRVRWEP